MIIKITRSFERTRQIADFVPVKAYCEASEDFDISSVPEGTSSEDVMAAVAKVLDEFCQSEVEKTLMGYHPACINCGGKQAYGGSGLTKEGFCAECNKSLYGITSKGRR